MAFLLLAKSSAEVDKNQEMELTIGSLNILIRPSGSTRLSDLTKPDPSVNKTEMKAILESSEGSSSEVNLPVSIGETQIAECDEIQEKIDIEEKAFETRNNVRDFTAESSGVSNRVHIITEAEEESNHEGSVRVDKQIDKIRDYNQKEKEKIHVSAGEWRIIMTAINHGTEVPEGSRREVLMGYQYALHQHNKKLREERDMFATN
jgi:hypothetical protein